MYRFTILVAFFGFGLALSSGCGSKKVDGTGKVGGVGEPTPILGDLPKQDAPSELVGGVAEQSPKMADTPKRFAPGELPPAVRKLADLEKTIAAKEKELADLKAEANTLRQADVNTLRQSIVYRTPGELLADMPMDAYPKFGADAGIERAKARKWVKANLIDRTIEAEWTVIDGGISVVGNDPYTVVLSFDETTGTLSDEKENPNSPALPSHTLRVRPFGDPILLGNQSCQIYIEWGGLSFFRQSAIEYLGCTDAEATKLKGFNKQKVRLRATITGAIVSDSRATFNGQNLKDDALPIGLRCTVPTIDGFIPENSRHKSKESEPKLTPNKGGKK